jgi:hypothetical protein
MTQLDRGKRPMLVHGIGHQCQRRYVTVVPQATLDVGCDVPAWVYLTNFRGHHAPPAFRLDTAHRRHRTWMAVSHAVAVRHLIKAIRRSDWTNGDRLEQGGISFIC